MHRYRTIALAGWSLVLFAAAAAAAAAGADDYEIKLTRPARVGQKYQVIKTFTTKSSTATTRAGQEQPRQETTTVISCQGVSEVLRVDEKGHVIGASFTVDKLVKTEGDTQRPLLKKGDVVLGSVDKGETTCKLKDGELSDEAGKELRQVLELYTGIPDEDESFGTTWRQKPGASWPFNVEVLAKALTMMGSITDKSDIGGKATLIGPVSVGGVPALEVAFELNVKKFGLPAEALPPGFHLEKSSSSAIMSFAYPLDPALRLIQGHIVNVTTAIIVGKANAGDPETAIATTEKHTVDEMHTPIR